MKPDNKQHQCDKCGRAFATPHGLSTHKVRSHTEKGKTWGKGKKVLPPASPAKFCPCCGLNLEVLQRAIQIAQEIK